MERQTEHTSQRLELSILLAAAVMAWAPSARNGFVWLDHVEIEEAGYRVRNFDDFKKLWSWSLGSFLERDYIAESGPRGAYFRPIYAMANSVSDFLWKDHAAMWHLEAVFWHALVVLLLYQLGLRVAPPDRHDAWRQAVFWACLLFAVHPLGAQSIAWISGRKDTLCAAFSLIAIHAFLNSGETGGIARRRGAWRAVCGAAFVVALGCKELALLIPVLLTAGAVTNTFARPRDWAQRLLLGTLWCVAIAFAIYRARMLGGFGLGAPPPETSLAGRVAMSASVFWEYISRILLPRPGILSDSWPLTREGTASLIFVATFLGALTGLTVCFFKIPRARFPLLWFGIWLLPASGITPLWHFRAERYLYPASWGLLVVVVLALQEILRKLRKTDAAADPRCGWILSAVAAASIATTWLALPTWNSTTSLFNDAVRRDPNHAEAHGVLGERAMRKNDLPSAEKHLRKALAIVEARTHATYLPPFVTRNNLGLTLYRQRRYDEALAEFRRAETFRPNNAAAHYHVGLAALALDDLGLAEQKFREALKLRPTDILSRANLAVTFMKRGDLEGCIETYRPLIEEGWGDLQGLRNYASVLLALRRHAEALPFFERIVAADPDDALSMAKLAWCQDELGEREAARETLRAALAKDGGNPVILDIARRLEYP